MSTKVPNSSPDSRSSTATAGAAKSLERTRRKPSNSITESILNQTTNRDWKKNSLLTLLSLFLHLFALGTLGLIVITNPQFVEEIFTTLTENEEQIEPVFENSLILAEAGHGGHAEPQDEFLTQVESSDLQFENKGPIALNFNDKSPQIDSDSSDRPRVAEIKVGKEMAGRMSVNSKRAMVEQFGGTAASEAAVDAGLKWLANHQLADGSWNFAHSKHPECKGQCSQNGTLTRCRNGATGLALLAFLGAGHTQFNGEYKDQVGRALEFLRTSGKRTKKGYDLRGNVFDFDGIYVQGICAIALCECSAMTLDTRVRNDAQGAIDFIVSIQNPSDGGWRYLPGQPGDTSVVGWQLMALKSAQNARIEFSNKAFKGVEQFLDTAQAERGSQYFYVPRRRSGPTGSMTAVGLLCRMYLGWDRTNAAMASGVQFLDETKPDPSDMYYNYYATQVMHHWGGEEWTRWNQIMREHLIKTQHPVRSGHQAGSWDVADYHGKDGGRLYMTCLCVMTLEVYYRHLPLYNRDHLKVDF